MKKCLVVVDYQNDFVSGSLGFAEALELEEQIAQKIMEYRNNGDEVVFTFDTHQEDYMDTQGSKSTCRSLPRGYTGSSSLWAGCPIN